MTLTAYLLAPAWQIDSSMLFELFRANTTRRRTTRPSGSSNIITGKGIYVNFG